LIGFGYNQNASKRVQYVKSFEHIGKNATLVIINKAKINVSFY